MAIYVMSDIHGEYDKYLRMLNKIRFSDNDDLIILGDVVDKGSQPIELLRDMMMRPNVYPIMGNHDLLALDVLRKLAVDITEENAESQVDITVMNELIDWLYEGGKTTYDEFVRLDKEEREEVIEYLSEFSYYEVIDVGEKTFILVHAGLGNFRPDKKLSEYSVEELIMYRTDPEKKYFDDDSVYVVTGHTPTLIYSGKPEIYRSHNNICIDCGAVSECGRLACLCLDTMEEFYV